MRKENDGGGGGGGDGGGGFLRSSSHYYSIRERERDFEEWPGVDVREAVAVCALTILAGQCVSDSLFLSVCALLRQMTSDELSLSLS